VKKTVALASTFLLGTLALSAVATGSSMSTAKTERVSVSSKGAQGNLPSWAEGISANGRYVVFSSGSAGLVPRDTNRRQDAFLRDRNTGRTTRVSVSSSGRQGKAARDPFGGSAAEAISAGGRYILFRSDAPNLVSGDTNGVQDIFIRDRKTHRTTRVSIGGGGRQANGPSDFAVLSPNGRYVAFSSGASNLVPGDTNRAPDVFVRDRAKGTTQRISVSSRARQANRESEQSAISADGRYVAFESGASNLVPGDTNATTDVFVRDRRTGRTTRVSVNSRGKQGTGDRTHNGSNGPSISADGRYVAFHSGASNLVPHDTNRTMDIFMHDRVTGNTQRVSVSSSGAQANGENIGAPRISADGRYVAFASMASNLIPRDVNDITDAFVRDLRSDRTGPRCQRAQRRPRVQRGQPLPADLVLGESRPRRHQRHGGCVRARPSGHPRCRARERPREPLTARRSPPRARRWLASSSSSWRSARWSRNARRCAGWARARRSWRRTA
jgi:Tol biopolymer transport system component